MVDVFTILWRCGARFNIYGDMAKKLIMTALIKQNTVLCEKLLSVGITKNTNPSPSVFSNILEIFPNKTINVYNIFREYFVNANFQWCVVEQPLIHFVIKRFDFHINRQNLEFFEILIKHGFDFNARDYLGNLPVHVAARLGYNVIIKQLTHRNTATVETTNHFNQAPLHLAAKNGHKKVFDFLKGFDVDDFRDDFGKTAEDYAVENGHFDKLYVEHFSLYS